MTNADKFKQIFGLYATELWSKTEGEFLAWLNSDFSQSDVPDMNVGDMISRQDAIDAVSRGCQEFRGIFARCEKNLNELPSAKPEPCEDAVSRAEAQTALQFVARRYTVAHEAHGEGHVVWSDNLISVPDAMNALREVPSAEPERKKGEWIYGENDGQDGWYCSKCGFFIPWYYEYYGLDNIDFISDYHTCPKCDANMIKYTGMRGEQDGTEK